MRDLVGNFCPISCHRPGCHPNNKTTVANSTKPTKKKSTAGMPPCHDLIPGLCHEWIQDRTCADEVEFMHFGEFRVGTVAQFCHRTCHFPGCGPAWIKRWEKEEQHPQEGKSQKAKSKSKPGLPPCNDLIPPLCKTWLQGGDCSMAVDFQHHGVGHFGSVAEFCHRSCHFPGCGPAWVKKWEEEDQAAEKAALKKRYKYSWVNDNTTKVLSKPSAAGKPAKNVTTVVKPAKNVMKVVMKPAKNATTVVKPANRTKARPAQNATTANRTAAKPTTAAKPSKKWAAAMGSSSGSHVSGYPSAQGSAAMDATELVMFQEDSKEEEEDNNEEDELEEDEEENMIASFEESSESASALVN